MTYGSVCSGIEAATVAWSPLGWKPAWFAEVVDLLVGGTPCQAFSVAGLRGGMDDERGKLTLEFLKLAGRLRPRWLAWENVPGVLSIDGGRTFGAVLGGLAELGYGFAYRVLDAQFFGVPQRRRRVFLVGYLGDWRCAAAVLFERHCLSGHPAPSRQAGQAVAALTSTGVGVGGPVASACNAHGGSGRMDFESGTFIAHALRADGWHPVERAVARKEEAHADQAQ